MSLISNLVSNINNFHKADTIFNGDAIQYYACELKNAPRTKKITKFASHVLGCFGMALINPPRVIVHLGLGTVKTGTGLFGKLIVKPLVMYAFRKEYHENSWGWGMREAGSHFLQAQAGLIDWLTLPLLNLNDPFKVHLRRVQTTPEIRRMLSILNTHPIDVNAMLEIMQTVDINQRIYVWEPPANELMDPNHPRKVYYAASSRQINAEAMPLVSGVRKVGHNHTTTLANMISTNELRFERDDYLKLFNRLIELNADFSAVDYTDYFYHPSTHPFYSIQNNPLKSLIAQGSGNTHFDEMIIKLLKHIGKIPDDSMKKRILNARDAFPFGAMTPVFFLIRQGKEDLALEAIKTGADVTVEDLRLACESFGSTCAARPKGVDCVFEIIRKLTEKATRQGQEFKLDSDMYRACLAGLKKASPEEYAEHRQRRRDALAEDQNSRVALRIKTQLRISDQQFAKACEEFADKSKPLSAHSEQILDWTAQDAINTESIGRGLFQDYYRANEEYPNILKFNYLKTAEGSRNYARIMEAIQKIAP